MFPHIFVYVSGYTTKFYNRWKESNAIVDSEYEKDFKDCFVKSNSYWDEFIELAHLDLHLNFLFSG